MNEEYLLERIIKDAKTEAKKIVSEAKDNAAGNVEYAHIQAKKEIAEAAAAVKKTSEYEEHVRAAEREIAERIEILRQKTQIVDQVFEEVKKELKYDWCVVDKENYEIRFTADEVMENLREEIEAEIVRILWND